MSRPATARPAWAGGQQASCDRAAHRSGATGALTQHGAPIPLPTRPIHMATDIPSRHILVAFNNPSAIRVYRINADGTPGAEVAQPGPIDAGIFAHQVRATPDNRQVILVARGHDAADGKPEEPGALKVFDFNDGVLSNESLGRTRWRLRLRPAASGFPSVAALGLCVAGTAERARHVRAGEWRAVAHAAVSQERAGQPRRLAPGGRHGARASEWPHRLCRQPRRQCGRREFAGGLCDRPGDRRTAPDPAHRLRTACIRAPSTSIPAVG